MKLTALFLLSAGVAFSQTATKPPMPAANAPKAPAAAPKMTAAQPAAKPGSQMPVLQGVVKTLFTERYEEIKIGTGPAAEPNKLYSVLYTGYLASTGQKFDSSSEHPMPVMKDGKPVMGPDGKPQLGPPQPLVFPQGMGRLIPGFDQGFTGMRVGGKRRIFIPWQLAYGTHEMPAREGHIAIPARSDLVFDVELVNVQDLPTQPMGTGMPVPHPAAPPTPGNRPPTPSAPGNPPAGSAAPSPAPPAPSSTPATTAEPK